MRVLDGGKPPETDPGDPGDPSYPPPTYVDGGLAPEPPEGDAGPVAPEPPPPGTGTCDVRGPGGGSGDPAPVYYGTPEPTYLDLSPGQVQAVGLLDLGGGLCSGTLIAPRWVITARHCTEGVSPSSAQFVIGTGREPDRAVPIRRFVNNPSTDLALVELARDATEMLASVVPIPIVTETVDRTWVGRSTEAGGYGRTERGSTGTRYFSSLPIRDVDSEMIYFDGGGRGGVCNGDSGGPLLARASDGSVRLIGAVSGGDGTCTYQAWFTRIDPQRSWVEGNTGPTTPPPGGCGGVTAEGRCMDGSAIWCEGTMLRSQRCATGTTCGYDRAASGYRCVTDAVPDACGGVDAHGRCDGSTAVWCDAGVLRRRDCATCDGTPRACGESAEHGGIYCISDPCMGIDYLGRCEGAVAVWCDSGMLRRRDCGAEGRTCAWIDDTSGYYCR